MTQALTTRVLGALFLALAAIFPARAAEERVHPYAVVVGIDRYADPQIKARPHAEADAQALYDLFTSKDYLGADARLLLGQPDAQRHSQPATRANILKALHWAAAKARRDDPVLFVFLGEGAPLGERSCYFASDSTFKGRAKNAVAAAEIEHELEGLKSQRFVAFLDVNFKGFDSGKEPAPDLNLTNFYKEFLGKDEKDHEDALTLGRVLFLANRGLSPAIELEQHGLFAQVLLDALKGKADTEGYEPDGRVTVEELKKYVEKAVPELARKYGKSREDKEQIAFVLPNHVGRFALTLNPAVAPKVSARLRQFAQLAADKNLAPELAEEGHNLLSRMPKLEAHRSLRRNYEQLADGRLTAEDFLAAREQILDGMKLSRRAALHFAARVIDAAQQVSESYIKELDLGEMVAWGTRGLYQSIDEKIPQDVKDRVDKAKEQKEVDLTMLLADVRERLGKREDLAKHKDIDLALQRMLSHLDPYTTYIDPETLSQFEREIRKNYTGVGIQIRKDAERDMILVVTPIKGSPAYRAGIKAGDVITTIVRETDSEGKPLDPPEKISTKGLSLNEAVKKILGREKTKVKLVVRRPGVDHPLEFELTRDQIDIETVFGVQRKDDDSWDYYLDHANKIAYVRLASFARYTARDLVTVMNKLKKKGINGLVLDLRFNPGGLLTSAVLISDLFIDDGMIVSIRPRVGREQRYGGEHDRSFTHFPMVCLINGGSASGSEIVAACLQDHHRAVVMGGRSYGKGSVQNIQNFEGGQLKMTTASYWRPSGKNINRASTSGKESDEWGVTPDKGHVLKLSAKEREALFEHQRDSEIIPNRGLPEPQESAQNGAVKEFKDKQLDKALEYLRGQLKYAAKITAKKAG
jgi:C-terminal peptidase prc